MADLYSPLIPGAISDTGPYRQRKLAFQIAMEGRYCGLPAVFFSFLLPGALLKALSAFMDRAPNGLQHGPGHLGPPWQGHMAPGATL